MAARYLIDTHIFLWWLFDDSRLDEKSRAMIRDTNNEILVSSASAWEISTKYRIGKLPEAKILIENYAETLKKAGFSELTITNNHALRAGLLPITHRDPFDRMIMAQAELENIPVITYDKVFKNNFVTVFP